MDTIEQAPAPAEQSPVVEPEATEPQETQETPQNEATEAKPRRSRREALEKAFADVDKDDDKGGQDADVKVNAKRSDNDDLSAKNAKTTEKAPEKAEKTAETQKNGANDKKEGPERGPDGKFVAKDAAEKPTDGAKAEKAPDTRGKLTEPPARFSEDAKKAWAEAPESVRAETYRAIRETEQGIQKYQQAMEPLKPFMQLAQGDPRKLASAMQRYVNTENLLRENPAQGFREVARNIGLSAEQVGKMLLNQDPGQPDPRDREIHTMRQQNQQLSQAVVNLEARINQMIEHATLRDVESFASSNEHFDDLADDIAYFLESRQAADLKEAYQFAFEKAQRAAAKFAPQPEPEPAPAQPAQTRPARSVTGAPTPGSNPAHRKPSSSRKEALENAMRRAGF